MVENHINNARYRELYLRLINGFSNALGGDPHPETIYHYTTLEGFLGILGGENPSLHATQIRFLNDSTELLHGINLLTQEVNNRRSSADSEPQLTFMTILLQTLSDMRENNGTHEFFVVSFTSQRDLLSQWRGYGATSTPVTLGFKTVDFIQTGTNAPDAIGFSILQCVYAMEEKISICNRVLDSVMGLVDDAWTLPSPLKEIALNSLARATAMIPAIFKDQSFSEEQEWRFIYPRDNRVDSLPIKFKSRDHLSLPYVELEFKGGFPLTEVIVGPSQVTDLTLESIRYYMKHSVFDDVPVTKSLIPFR